jgi:flagellar assembly protein FliH
MSWLYNKVFKKHQVHLMENLKTQKWESTDAEDFGKEPREARLKDSSTRNTMQKDEEGSHLKNAQDEEAHTDRGNLEQEFTILEKAKQEAEEIIQSAYLKAVQIERESKEKAYQEGYQEAQKEVQKHHQKLIEDAEKVLLQYQENYKKVMYKAEKDLVALALEIAKKVIGYEVTANPESIVHLAKEALSKTMQKEGVVIKVSKEDGKVLLENLDNLRNNATMKQDFIIEESALLQKGDLLVQTSFGVVDGSVHKKLEMVGQAFKDALEVDNP